ncbi:peptidase [Streptomyces sp. NPDC001816]|uniref:peptidase n=1 Tax=Streptomyces sp. NPDC001816 TaxID=3364612 RepID=UPI0036781207
MSGGHGQDKQPTQPQGSFGLRLLEAPVIRRDDPRAYTSIVDHLNPGAVIRRRVEVSNMSPNPLRIELYAAAASIEKRTFTFAPRRTPNELTEWTSLDHSALTLNANSKETARITIRVPPKASRGERYGVVWAQVASSGQGNIQVVNRVGIRMYLDIGPGGEPPSDFRIDKLTPGRSRDGRPELAAQVRNTGERALEISGRLSLSEGPAGLRAGPYRVPTGTTLALGDTGSVKIVLDDRLPDGPWTARLTLTSGRVQKTATATVTFPAAGMWGTAVMPADISQWPPTLSWGLAAVAAILAVLGIRTLKQRHAQRRDPPADRTDG